MRFSWLVGSQGLSVRMRCKLCVTQICRKVVAIYSMHLTLQASQFLISSIIQLRTRESTWSKTTQSKLRNVHQLWSWMINLRLLEFNQQSSDHIRSESSCVPKILPRPPTLTLWIQTMSIRPPNLLERPITNLKTSLRFFKTGPSTSSTRKVCNYIVHSSTQACSNQMLSLNTNSGWSSAYHWIGLMFRNESSFSRWPKSGKPERGASETIISDNGYKTDLPLCKKSKDSSNWLLKKNKTGKKLNLKRSVWGKRQLDWNSWRGKRRRDDGRLRRLKGPGYGR